MFSKFVDQTTTHTHARNFSLEIRIYRPRLHGRVISFPPSPPPPCEANVKQRGGGKKRGGEISNFHSGFYEYRKCERLLVPPESDSLQDFTVHVIKR